MHLRCGLAYAAPANTSISRSRTTGEPFCDCMTSSSVSKNRREEHWAIKTSCEFLSMIAQSCHCDPQRSGHEEILMCTYPSSR